MSDSYLGTGFNNGPTPSNPWADYLANRNNRKHEQLMENKRHTNNVELASMQHQHSQDRDKKNYKRGKKVAGLDRAFITSERLGAEAHRTGERLGTEAHEVGQTSRSQQFTNEQARLAATDAINQTREEKSQERRTYKSNLRAGAEVVRGMAKPTDVGDRSIASYGISRDGVQAVHGATTPGPSNGGGDSGGGGGNSDGGPPTPPASDGAPTAPKPSTARTPKQETAHQAKLARERESRKLANEARANAKNTGTEVTPAPTEVKPAPKKKGKNPATAGKNPAAGSTATPVKPQGWSRTKKGLVLLAAAALVPK